MPTPHPLNTESVHTRSRNEMVEVTDRVADLVRSAKIQGGMAIAFVPHTTAAITINENADPDVKSDLLRKLSTLIPKEEPYYQHGEGNSDSHLKTALTGNSVTVLIENSRLVLGRWQGIYFCEFDGPRHRQLHIKLVSFE
jgi:secondary thiamine-phosphate synthase enzyme